MNCAKKGWDNIKQKIDKIDKFYSFHNTKKLLIKNNYYKNFIGKSKNRLLMRENPKLYKSIYKYTKILEDTFRKENRYYGTYNFSYRIKFIVNYNGDITKLLCQCGQRHGWTKYCRRCPDYHRSALGKSHSNESKKKMRISTLKYLKTMNGQVVPRYNVNSIHTIEEYGKQNGYNFQHAENGGEHYIKELGYFVDGYDKENNIVLEIDEKHHNYKKQKQRDDIREKEIKKFLKCKFIRLKV